MITVNQSVEKEFTPAKKYVGISIASVIAVNPDKAHLAILTGRDVNEIKDPVYTGTMKNDQGKDIKTCRVEIWCNIMLPEGTMKAVKASFDLRKQGMKSKAEKIKVIDPYGRTAWVTVEEFKNHAIPQYQNGPAALDANYRCCYRGEEELTAFLRSWLHIYNPRKFDNATGKWINSTDPDFLKKCEARLEEADIDKMVSGDFSLLQGFVEPALNNSFKVAVGLQKGVMKVKDAAGNIVQEKPVTYQAVWTDANATCSSRSTQMKNIVNAIVYEQQNPDSKWILDVADIHEFVPPMSAPAPMEKNEEIFDMESGKSETLNAGVDFANDLPF